MQTVPGRRGFTLIELLVVIAIIALLIGILLPSLGAARESSRRTICGTRLGQLLTASHMLVNDNDGRLPGSNWTSPQLDVGWLYEWSWGTYASDTGGDDLNKRLWQASGQLWPYLGGKGGPDPVFKRIVETGEAPPGFTWTRANVTVDRTWSPGIHEVYICPSSRLVDAWKDEGDLHIVTIGGVTINGEQVGGTPGPSIANAASFIANGSMDGYSSGNGAGESIFRNDRPYRLYEFRPNSMIFWEAGNTPDDRLNNASRSDIGTNEDWNNGGSYPGEGLTTRHYGEGANLGIIDGSVEWFTTSDYQAELEKPNSVVWNNPRSRDGGDEDPTNPGPPSRWRTENGGG